MARIRKKSPAENIKIFLPQKNTNMTCEKKRFSPPVGAYFSSFLPSIHSFTRPFLRLESQKGTKYPIQFDESIIHWRKPKDDAKGKLKGFLKEKIEFDEGARQICGESRSHLSVYLHKTSSSSSSRCVNFSPLLLIPFFAVLLPDVTK